MWGAEAAGEGKINRWVVARWVQEQHVCGYQITIYIVSYLEFTDL